MSALVDPFIDSERKYMISKRLLELCVENNVPLVINTKSTLILEDPWFSLINNLKKKHKLVVQLTITHNSTSPLEPFAPPNDTRLFVAKELSKRGIPIVVRIQPIIPMFNADVVDDLIVSCYKAGARQVILEFLKFNSFEELQRIEKVLGLKMDHRIFELLPDGKQYSVRGELRVSYMLLYYRTTKRLGIEFSTCKGGFIHLHTAKNCCGLHHLGKYFTRRTIEDILGIGDPSKNIFSLEQIRRMPRPLRKKLLAHERVLDRIYQENIYRLLIVEPTRLQIDE